MAAQEGWQRQAIRVVEAAQLGLWQWPNKDSREKKRRGERGYLWPSWTTGGEGNRVVG